ncbi:hypothetical protein PUN28_003731 [Cardiocondyla obscurior]|uniref:Integrase catalytic domain-containing protein n=1 Tax=Cardiocondyla obscurior TaxID=286306 RepID=A0AAW2GMV6_9HYME
MFKQTCKLLKIEKIQTTAYHFETNGALERSHKTLAEYLRHYLNEEQTDWDEWLPYAIRRFRTITRRSSTAKAIKETRRAMGGTIRNNRKTRRNKLYNKKGKKNLSRSR